MTPELVWRWRVTRSRRTARCLVLLQARELPAAASVREVGQLPVVVPEVDQLPFVVREVGQ